MSISISPWSICVSSVYYFCRIDISRLPLRPSKDTFCLLTTCRASGIVTTSNFVRRWTGGHLAIHLETGPTVLPFGSGRSNRISMSDLSFTRKRVPLRARARARARLREWFASIPVFTRAVIFYIATRLWLRVDERSMRRQKKIIAIRGLLHFEVLARSRRQ